MDYQNMDDDNTINLNLIPKRVGLIIEAMELQIKKQDKEIRDEILSEDELADISNDLSLLKDTLDYVEEKEKYYLEKQRELFFEEERAKYKNFR